MTTTSAPTVLRFSTVWLWLFGLGGLALGCGIGFAVPFVGQWLVDTVHEIPGPLRIAMTVPRIWLVPITTVIGALAGLALFGTARNESLALTVAGDHVELAQNGREQYVSRAEIAAVFREHGDLVVTDRNRLRLARFRATDLRARAIEQAFRDHGYPWLEQNDPYGADFTRWVDGLPETGADIDTLMRSRRRAIADKKSLEVEDLDDKLLALGVDVRDRKGEQQIRIGGQSSRG
ncbi:YqeB family protein [Nocardia sp. CA-107356]|uniref:YqeB family protein n=1 Tax=Nocardia sp. CA-107356 TaxID=3239972 RepID=UPI003D9339A5